MILANYETDKDVLKLFKAVKVDNLNSYKEGSKEGCMISQQEIELLKHGILLDPTIFASIGDARRLQEIKENAIKLYGVDSTKLNSTFWKNWDYTNQYSELEQKVLQAVHYFSTYGQGLVGRTSGGFTPDSDKDLENINLDVFKELTYIEAITQEELETKIKNMLVSGIALRDDTLSSLESIIRKEQIDIDYVDEISNREFMCKLCQELNIIPKNFDEFTRYLIYLATGETLLIKNKHLYDALDKNTVFQSRVNVGRRIINYAEEYGIEKMAQNITRYRKIYLIIRKHSIYSSTRKIINKALKLSKTMYIPRKQNPLERIMDKSLTDDEIKEAASHATVFKLVKVINYLKRYDKQDKLYRIRNGKSYLVDVSQIKAHREEILLKELSKKISTQFEMAVNRIGQLTKRLAKIYYIPEGVNYAAPTSEKEFVGSLPYMSYFDVEGEDLVVGITWDKPVDLDLHGIDTEGNDIGWDMDNSSAGITYSGDMTTTNKYGYAAEYLRFDHERLNAPVTVTASLYDYLWDDDIDFDIFATTSSVSTHERNIIDQLGTHTMLSHDKFNREDGVSKVLATVFPVIDEETGKKHLRVVFTAMGFGNTRVPGVDNLNTKISNIVKYNSEHTLMMSDLIKAIGNNVTTNWKRDEVDWSPSKMTPSTFIDMMSGNNG